VIDRLRHQLHAALALILGKILFHQPFGAAAHHRHHIVEVVGDAAGDAAQNLHALRLLQRLAR